jgi:hypothetical protein
MPKRGTAIPICRPPRIFIVLFKPSCQCLKKPIQIRLREAHPIIFNTCPSLILAWYPSVIESALTLGMAIVLSEMTEINYTIIFYAATLIILVGSFALLGKAEGVKIILLSIIFPAILVMFEVLHLAIYRK